MNLKQKVYLLEAANAEYQRLYGPLKGTTTKQASTRKEDPAYVRNMKDAGLL